MFALKDLVAKGKVTRFSCLMADSLWYETEDGFAFPVPLSETAGATFLAEDKAVLYMRHIRKHLPVAIPLVAGLARLMAGQADGPAVRFVRFTAMEMWFAAEDGLEFPVPVQAGDTVSAVEPSGRFATHEQAYREALAQEKARCLAA